jgi:predicted small lipoprotein YifL
MIRVRLATAVFLLALVVQTSSSGCGRYGPPLRGPAAETAPPVQVQAENPEAEPQPKPTERDTQP